MEVSAFKIEGTQVTAPERAAGPYRNTGAKTDVNQLKDLPRTLSMMNATTLTPTTAPMKAPDVATMPLICSPKKLVPFFRAGAGLTNVPRATISASTNETVYKIFAVVNE